ncbi:MAG: hypothetical protein U0930_04750 [Pirellulales bacterium]
MTSIKARAVLTGFTLGLVPTVNPLQNQAGQVVGAQVESSAFSPRISTYIVHDGQSLFRGEKSFTFGATKQEPENGVHKGLLSKKDFFAKEFQLLDGSTVTMATVVSAFQSTATALLDDTVDGQNTDGTIELEYRIDQISASLTEHDLANNYVQVDFGIYEPSGKQRLATRVLRYIPDSLVEPQRIKRSQAEKRLNDALLELEKLNSAAGELDQTAPEYQLELVAISQKIEQQTQVYLEAAKSLGSSESVTFFPLSQLWAEVGIPQAISLLVVCVYSELVNCSYLMASYDLSALASIDLESMLYLYAHMKPKPEA